MHMSTAAPRYTQGEEIANSVIHGVGAALSIAGLTVLVAFASLRGDVWHIVTGSIFGATLILMYAASTLYHAIQHPTGKRVLRVLDHAAIFLLIAGTYTPFTLVNLRGVWGWSLFGVIWGLAILGVVFQVTILRRWAAASVGVYVLMGWAVVAAIKPMLAAVAPSGLLLLLLGGVCYTGGVGFYIWHRLPYHHALWHLFVLAGSACHYFAVLFFVIPPAAG